MVFLAVTWSVMGVGGRTATLVGLTLTTGGLTAWAARRGLRGAVESLGLVTPGWPSSTCTAPTTRLVRQPVRSRHDDDRRGDPGPGGLAATWALARTAAQGFTGGELAAVAGAALVSVGLVDAGWGAGGGPQLVVGVCCSGPDRGGVAWRAGRAATCYRVAGLGASWARSSPWTGRRSCSSASTTSARRRPWPRCGAARGVALIAAARSSRCSSPYHDRGLIAIRVVAAAAGLVPLGVVLWHPRATSRRRRAPSPSARSSACLVALMAFAPAPWGATGLRQGGALCVLVLGYSRPGSCGYAALENYVGDRRRWPGAGAPAAAWPSPGVLDGRPPWLLPECVARRSWGCSGRPDASPKRGGSSVPLVLRAVAGLVLGVSAVSGCCCCTRCRCGRSWSAALAAGGAATWPALRDRPSPTAVVGAAGSLGTVVLSSSDEELTDRRPAVTLVLAGAVHLQTRRRAGWPRAAVGGGRVLARPRVDARASADLDGPWASVVGLVVLGGGDPRRGRTCRVACGPLRDALVEVPQPASRAAGLRRARRRRGGDRRPGSPCYLTVAGAAAGPCWRCPPDRRRVGWLGGGLLAAATWVRLADLGVTSRSPTRCRAARPCSSSGCAPAPRPVGPSTLRPSAPGSAWRSGPVAAVGADRADGLRALLLGLACLGLVSPASSCAGPRRSSYGATVGLLVVLREAAPYIGDSVPRWAVIGAAGAR